MIYFLQLLNTSQEKEVFARLYEMYSQPLYGAALAIMNDRAASEDMVHETFLILTDHMDKVMNDDTFKNWSYLVTILRHSCFNVLRKQEKINFHNMETDFAGISSGNNIEADIVGKEKIEVLRDLIRQLNYPYREVIILQYYNQLKSKDIARVLNLTPENVRQIATRARKQLKDQLTERGYD
ncbi:sigma-70 family RNA polymerase sigma factor [Eubacterium sp. An3]|uniref:RNA polymerase sigma factor n=1 Tax=Eubacterium sp. An3 TaxID=1965628 RepID=UPI000B39409C|nr:sigma-70 family RNA polymerase sigma factor [Eubacterium sp. An3]OUO29592.1 hypothetical protein B5F87_03560 [Eubacterium sp. An3]